MLRRREPSIEQVADVMRRHCADLTVDELRRLRRDLSDEVNRLRSTRRYRLGVRVPWETGVEWRVRELLAVRSVATQAVVSMDDRTLDIALVVD